MRISDWSSDVCSSYLAHAIAIGLGNADAGVRHLEQHLALGTASGERHHAALAGELQRVGQQVEQRLTQAAAVSHQFAGIVVAREAQIDAAAVGALADRKSTRLNSSH